MRLRNLTRLAVFLALGVSSVVATAPVPRKSPEFTIVEPSGKQTLLSSFNGKVVVIEFFLTNCPRCQRVTGTAIKLQKELGPRGFQAIGVAFDKGINGPMVADLVQRLGVTYPVGYASSDKVDGYLGRQPMERFRVPQIVVIDRKGVVRAQSRPTDEQNLEDENYLRNLIDSLLKEEAPARRTTRTPRVRRLAWLSDSQIRQRLAAWSPDSKNTTLTSEPISRASVSHV
jgi:thiol-disulfide isomerase/thioredoxin